MTARFYSSELIDTDYCELIDSEAHHLINVMRMKDGEHVSVFDGSGSEYGCEVESRSKKTVRLRVLSKATPERELKNQLHIAVCMPKGDRQKFLIEKLTELGTTQITPIETKRSVGKWTPSSASKAERYVIEASKQCGRNRLMNINESTSLAEFINSVEQNAETKCARLIAHPYWNGGNTAWSRKDACVIVGPEGGFTDEEINLATEQGFEGINLGARILRVETACIALASIFSASH